MKRRVLVFGRFVLSLMALALVMSACVEDEQAPFSGGAGDGSGSGSYINVKLPSHGDFYPGSVVMLSGSGFSGSDRVLVKNDFGDSGYDSSDGSFDYNGDGVPDAVGEVEAKVQSWSDDHLFFIIPGEVVTNNVYVYFVRDGVKYTLGRLSVNYVYLNYSSQEGDLMRISLAGGGFEDDVNRVYVRYMGYNPAGNMVVGNAKHEASITSVSYSALDVEVYAVGEMQLIYSRNGEEHVVGTVMADPYTAVQFPPMGSVYYPGYEVNLQGRCFIDGDRIRLLCTETNSYVDAETTVGADGISFVVPKHSNDDTANYVVYLLRDGVMVNLYWDFFSSYSIND